MSPAADFGIDTRELLLVRLQVCMRTLAPGVIFTLPNGETHRAIATDLGGRVYSKMTAEEQLDRYDFPCVELITAADRPDSVTVHDDGFYERDVAAQIWGYARATDGGQSRDAAGRAALNALLADIQVAVEAFQFWTSADYPEPLTATLGPVIVTPGQQYIEPSTDDPIGFVALDYSFRYSFKRLFP